jgi:hypothetical protein
MNANGQTATGTQELERHLRRLLAPSRLPANVKSARYELGTDHIGEPAVRIFLEIEPKFLEVLEKDKARRDELGTYRRDLAFKILRLESGYFPFIRLAEAA